jgi:hypothetical protein
MNSSVNQGSSCIQVRGRDMEMDRTREIGAPVVTCGPLGQNVEALKPRGKVTFAAWRFDAVTRALHGPNTEFLSYYFRNFT